MLTVKEIKEKLDELRIEYNDKMRKAELLELLNDAKRYVVIHAFKDLQDKNHIYGEGDIYPREKNKYVPRERIDELMSSKNKIGKPLIKEQA